MVEEKQKRQEARVASVIDPHATSQPTELVINQGYANSVKSGDQYLIYTIGEEIKDPLTGEVLGNLEVIRGRAKVIHVQEKFSTVQSIEQEMQRRRGQKISSYSLLFPGSVTEEDVFVTRPFYEVKVGDFARPI